MLTQIGNFLQLFWKLYTTTPSESPSSSVDSIDKILVKTGFTVLCRGITRWDPSAYIKHPFIAHFHWNEVAM